MNKALLTALTVATLAASTVAAANQAPAHQGGLYVGGSTGWANLVTNSKEDGVKTSKQLASNYALRADMGYLMSLSEKLLAGAELGYLYFPQATTKVAGADVTSKFMTFDMLGVVKYAVMSEANVFGKAGLAYVHTKANTKSDAFMPELAVGAGYNITRSIEATVTYAHAFGWNHNNPSFNTVLAGLDYHFSL